MSEPKEYWIRKGTSDFSHTFIDDDDVEIRSLSRGDQFYDAVVTEPIEGGTHVIEKSAYDALKAELDTSEGALEIATQTIVDRCAELQRAKGETSKYEGLYRNKRQQVMRFCAKNDELKLLAESERVKSARCLELAKGLIESHEGTYGEEFWHSPMGQEARTLLAELANAALDVSSKSDNSDTSREPVAGGDKDGET